MAELIEQKEGIAEDSNKARRSRSGLWFGVIIFLIIFAFAGAGYFAYTYIMIPLFLRDGARLPIATA